MRINDEFRKSVVFIGVRCADGSFSPYGTAFLVALFEENYGIGYIVTARHVLEDALKTGLPLVARVNGRNDSPALAGIDGPGWQFHPTISDCDLAVAPITLSDETFAVRYISLDKTALTPAYVHENDIGHGDEVFTVGLLARHFGVSQNIPVVRIGNIAAMPEEPVDLGALGQHSVYLIESRSIGGLSGSPVFLTTPPIRLVNRVSKDMGGHESCYLMGINIGLFETSAHADRAPSERLEKREDFLEIMSAGIAIVVPIERLFEILRTPAMAMERKRLVATLKQRSGFVPTSAAPKAGEKKIQVEPETDNPSHKEDFTRLLGAAARPSKPAS